MSDKFHTAQAEPKEDSLHFLAAEQADQAGDQLFDDYSQTIRGIFRGGLNACERVHDVTAALFSHVLGEQAAENHTSDLENDALSALKRGNLDAAQHYLDRNLRYTLWTQGLGDRDSRRIFMEYEMVSQANAREHREAKERAKYNPNGLISVKETEDPAVQMAALIVNRYKLQRAKI